MRYDQLGEGRNVRLRGIDYEIADISFYYIALKDKEDNVVSIAANDWRAVEEMEVR